MRQPSFEEFDHCPSPAPIVKGGQGRTASELLATLDLIVLIVALALALLAAGIVWLVVG